LPLPLAPEVIVSQLALLVAAQVQPVGAAMVTDPDPPAVVIVCALGETV
jgi:hypothetical protein